jgi:hypothetical protein
VAKEETFNGQSGATWRYWTDQPLGTPGGFGGVYAAEGSDGTPMAVKIVQKQRPSGALDSRLLRREVEIGRRIAEAGGDMLLPVIDAAETGEALLLVMARADGALADLALPLEQSAVIDVMADIATGLQQLHSIAILHRDLKPANVLRHVDSWKLADFGIARDEEIGTQNPTFVGWGSPPYMAPEIWEGKSPTVKTDLYALGCVAFELLAGNPPYQGDPAAIRTGHLSAAVPVVPSENATLRNLIVRLLDKDPGGRPQDARAVLERLQRMARPRSPVQDAIASGLGVHAAEKSYEAAGRAAAQAAEQAILQQIAQACADLREIAYDALEDLQDIEPDATLHDDHGVGRRRPGMVPERVTSSITLATADARLRIDVWANLTFQGLPAPEDTMIVASAVIITNRRYSADLNAANLVYEQVGDRLGWQIYRFRAAGLTVPDNYTFGPFGRTHGLKYEDFFGKWGRPFMIRPAGFHAWQKSVEPLTSGSLLGLFREAVDLRPPDPRTGLWPTG